MACEIIFGSPVHTVAEKVLSQKTATVSLLCDSVAGFKNFAERLCKMIGKRNEKLYWRSDRGRVLYKFELGSGGHQSQKYRPRANVPRPTILCIRTTKFAAL